MATRPPTSPGTRGCTAEACAFRDSHQVFAEAGAEVIGVSSDSVDRHAAFSGKYNLPFTLLSDAGGKVRKTYQVPATLGIIPGRVTYVIDRDGKRRIDATAWLPYHRNQTVAT